MFKYTRSMQDYDADWKREYPILDEKQAIRDREKIFNHYRPYADFDYLVEEVFTDDELTSSIKLDGEDHYFGTHIGLLEFLAVLTGVEFEVEE